MRNFFLLLTAIVLLAGCGKAPDPNGIAFEQKLGSQIPMDASFKDENGKVVKVGQYFGDKPVVVMPIFYTCAGRCTEILGGSVGVFHDLKKLNIGRDYEVVTISLNPTETPDLASNKKAMALEDYGREGSDKGWHFLTGPEKETRKITDAIGYRYTYDPQTGRIAHPSGWVLLTPSGKTSQYFFGTEYPAGMFLKALGTASKDQVGEKFQQPLLFGCFSHDPGTNKITMNVINSMKFVGSIFALLVFGSLIHMTKRYKSEAIRPA